MNQRIAEFFDDIAIEVSLLSFEDQLDLFLLFGGKITN